MPGARVKNLGHQAPGFLLEDITSVNWDFLNEINLNPLTLGYLYGVNGGVCEHETDFTLAPLVIVSNAPEPQIIRFHFIVSFSLGDYSIA